MFLKGGETAQGVTEHEDLGSDLQHLWKHLGMAEAPLALVLGRRDRRMDPRGLPTSQASQLVSSRLRENLPVSNNKGDSNRGKHLPLTSGSTHTQTCPDRCTHTCPPHTHTLH